LRQRKRVDHGGILKKGKRDQAIEGGGEGSRGGVYPGDKGKGADFWGGHGSFRSSIRKKKGGFMFREGVWVFLVVVGLFFFFGVFFFGFFFFFSVVAWDDGFFCFWGGGFFGGVGVFIFFGLGFFGLGGKGDSSFGQEALRGESSCSKGERTDAQGEEKTKDGFVNMGKEDQGRRFRFP